MILRQERGDFMTCFYCKGNMVDAVTTHFTEINGHIIIVKNVPCQKCTQCGEVVYSGSVVERLEQITEQLEKALTEIAVVNYTAA